jgi:hypothetical protein
MTMTKIHNKRRNAGLLYEFLIRTISNALVEGDKKKSTTALRLLKKHFKAGTELYREFRLINALVRSTVSSDSVASSILSEAKTAAKSYNLEALDKEKSHLIKNINYYLRDNNFFDQQINEYKAYATAQMLINNWRSEGRDKDIANLVAYEDQMVRWLVSEKTEKGELISQEDSPGMSRLLMKVMTQKLNEKYSMTLNDDQKGLLKSGLLSNIDNYLFLNKDDSYIVEKMNNVKGSLMNESIEHVDDDVITKFMLYVKLGNEINSEE